MQTLTSFKIATTTPTAATAASPAFAHGIGGPTTRHALWLHAAAQKKEENTATTPNRRQAHAYKLTASIRTVSFPQSSYTYCTEHRSDCFFPPLLNTSVTVSNNSVLLRAPPAYCLPPATLSRLRHPSHRPHRLTLNQVRLHPFRRRDLYTSTPIECPGDTTP